MHHHSTKQVVSLIMLIGALLLAPLTQAHAQRPTPPPPRREFSYETGQSMLPRLPGAPPAPQDEPSDGPPACAPWSKLAFASYRNESNWEVYTANGDGTAQTAVTSLDAPDLAPKFNWGCTRLVYQSLEGQDYEVYTINPTSPGRTRLTNNSDYDGVPCWSPGSAHIAFQTDRDDNSEVYVMNADGSGQANLTNHPAYDGMPAWSADGKIAFVSNRTGLYEIWVMNPDGTGQTQVTHGVPYAQYPCWSPDSSQIAFSNDDNGDGFLDINVVNADGTSLTFLAGHAENMDYWYPAWSPDGEGIAYSVTRLKEYHGQWYWTRSDIWVSDSSTPLVGSGYDWQPHWGTLDTQGPTSSAHALPTQSPGPFTVEWSGSDLGPSGIKSYDVQAQDGTGGAWTDWQMGTTATSASYPGVGGHTYYFRVRARDNATHVEPWPADYQAFTTVESLPPSAVIHPLPAYSRISALVSWGGSDPGNSGIATYDVQYRAGAGGSWIDWQVTTPATVSVFSEAAGHTYYFRIRATDNAHNVGSWSAGENACTSLYNWLVNGVVRDNRDTPVTGAMATTIPAAFVVIPSDGNGKYTTYVANEMDTNSVMWAKDRYGDLPATPLSTTRDAYVNANLPPADNVVLNWGFESGSLGPGWQVSGGFASGVTETPRHSGRYAASSGQEQLFASPSNISNTPDMSDFPQVAVDGSGIVHVVWCEDVDHYGYNVYHVCRGSNGSWSSPRNISNGPGYTQVPQLAVDESGAVHVVWMDLGVDDIYDIYYARRANDGTWSSPLNISHDPGLSETPQLVIDSDGTVHVVWGTYEIYYARRESDGTWSSPQKISADLFSFDPQLAVDEQGVAHVVWIFSGEIYYTRRSSDSTWSSPQCIANNAGSLAYLGLAADRNRIIHVVWCDYNSTIYYAQRGSDGVWTPPRSIFGHSGEVRNLQLAVDRSGAVHVVWDDRDQIYYAQRESTGDWSDPQNISDTPGYSERPLLAVGGDNTIHVVWVDSATTAIGYARRWINGAWSKPRAFHIGYVPNHLRFVVGTSGTVHLVWEASFMGSNFEIYHSESAVAESITDDSIAQAITVPNVLHYPTLSFVYWLDAARSSGGGWLEATVSNGIASTQVFSTSASTPGWAHAWADMSPWAGQTITLTFNVHNQAGASVTWAYLDEVSLGSAYPNLWVSKNSSTAPPGGGPVRYTLTYGNLGGVPAQTVRLTDTLPAGVTFVAASRPPTSTAPLAWDVSDLPAGAGPFTLVVTATVDAGTPAWTTLANTVTIGAVTPEADWDNNTATALTFVGYRLYLPLAIKGG